MAKGDGEMNNKGLIDPVTLMVIAIATAIILSNQEQQKKRDCHEQNEVIYEAVFENAPH